VTGGFFSRTERFGVVGSTNDVVAAWLDTGTPEVCLAVAGEQAAGRGREDRTWVSPPGAGLLCSLGFRPAWLPPGRAWQIAASVSLAMADAAEEVAGLRDRTIRLKWPNDLVVEEADPGAPGSGSGGGAVRKLGGVLGESSGLGTGDPRVVVGIGLDADWAEADFPPDLAATMTSLRVVSGGRPIDREALLEAFTDRLEPRIEALRGGRFDVYDWSARQLTTGRWVRIGGGGGRAGEWLAVGLDAATGALLVADPAVPGGERAVHAGEVVSLRVADAARV